MKTKRGADMKKYIQKICLALTIVFACVCLCVPALAADGGDITAVPVKYTLSVDGSDVPLWAYEINGKAYFKLRDIAMAMSGTQKQFDVSWTPENSEVNLFPGAYTPIGGELTKPERPGNAAAHFTDCSIRSLNDWGNILAYIIDNRNYVKLSDLTAVLKLSSSCDEGNHTARIDTSPVISPAQEIGTAIDNMALSGKGNAYSLDSAGNVIISYDNGKVSAKAPLILQPAGSNAGYGTGVDEAGFYISKEKTAVAYGGAQYGEPVYVLTSGDMGKTWDKSEVIAVNVGVRKLYVGFSTVNNGWLVICNFHGMGHEDHYIYQTSDGGKTWTQISNPNDLYGRVATGAGFATSQIGFISYRYETEFQPAILRTMDGGYTWEKLYVTLPDEFKSYNKTPLSPVFSGNEGLYPIKLSSGDGYYKTIYLTSSDRGKTWKYDEASQAEKTQLPDTAVPLAALPDENIYIYGDSSVGKKGYYKGLYLSINGTSRHYEWQSMTFSYAPELILKDMDKDGKTELVIILTKASGTGLHLSDIHIINPEDFTEIAVENPLDIIKENVYSSIVHSDGTVTTTITVNGLE